MDDEPGAVGRPRRTLVLLRHAKSSWEHDLPDHERPLSARGHRDARAAGRWLAGHVGAPDLVLCSSAIRTRQTWAEAVDASTEVLAGAPVRVEDAIYEARPDTLLGLLTALPDDVGSVLLVGHGPGLPDVADRLNRTTGAGPLGSFKTCALAVFEVRGPWSSLGPGTATLTAFEVPRG